MITKHHARLVARLTLADPTYGTQQHQRDFIERMDIAQDREPCARDHEHTAKCYSEAALKREAKA